MWTNLAVGVFNIPTLGISNLTIDDRIQWLRAGVQRLVQYRDDKRSSAPSPRWINNSLCPSMIFVAPEYMFVSSGFKLQGIGDLKRNRFLSRKEHDQIVAELQRISQQYGRDLLFVPGTIAYREELPNQPVDRMERVTIAQQHIKTSARTLESQFKQPGQSYLDVTIAGPLIGKSAITPQKKLKVLDVAKKFSSTFYTATNIAYMFTNGKIVGSYAKRSDYHEVLPGAHVSTIFVPGIKPGRATVGGINFGIEICLDHGIGVLKGTPSVTGDLPRVHMICSATVGFNPNGVHVREGGYLIHASSNGANAWILRQLGGWKAPEGLTSEVINGWELRMGVIELDL